MAVSKITTESTSDASVIKSFLDENKAGTFLENAEISADNHTLTITQSVSEGGAFVENCTLKIVLREAAQTSAKTSVIVLSKGEDTTIGEFTIGGVNITNVGFWFKGAALCRNGLILNLYLRTSSNYTDAYCLLTVDSAGNFVMIYERANTGSDISTVGTGYRIAGYHSLDVASVRIEPQYGSQQTALAPVCLVSGILYKVPYAFAATQTQAADRGLSTLTAGSDSYISNGVWFVKD